MSDLFLVIWDAMGSFGATILNFLLSQEEAEGGKVKKIYF